MNKMHSKRTLMAKTKEELVDHIICLEHNLAAMRQSFEVQYANCVKMIDGMSLLNDTVKKARLYAPEEATHE